MNRYHLLAACCVAVSILAATSGCSTVEDVLGLNDDRNAIPPQWESDFGIAGRTLVTSGRNPYFILEPGFQLILRNEDGTERLAITVLNETLVVDGVTTRVVEEREWVNDTLIEVSRNFYAMDDRTKDVFYFGEDVDIFRGKKEPKHTGAWRAGVKLEHSNAPVPRAGLLLPGTPAVGRKYYQEIAPTVALDHAEIIDLNASITTPAGSFNGCLRVLESSALKPDGQDIKTYARGIGLVQDEDLVLVKYGFVKR